MRISKNNTFQTIRSEGGLLPSDLLQRLSGRDKDIPGVSESSYHLSGEKLNEAINRSWNRLSGAWKAFQNGLADVPDAEPATSVTREKWLLPLFEEFKFGRLQTSKAHTIDSKTYPISHGWGHLPIHLIGAHVDLDLRSQGVAGASRSSPHSMVQEFLNRSDDHLWAVVSNGLKLRILRDNITLTRQAFLEFDLAAMFEGESYSDFAVLWMVCHQSRVEAENPNLCWLEKWSQFAEESGTRALEKLREGVEQAIESLGRGFLAHPANTELRQKLVSGELDKQDYYRQLLRLIYRFIFLFVAEDREQLLVPDAHKSSRQHYADYYSLSRLRNLAERRIATQHTDLWKSLTLLFDLLGEKGCPALGLPALGSFLWSGKATAAFDGAAIANRDLLRAIYRLSFVQDASVRRSVDYRNLGAEELGSIYEALLEMHPQIDLGAKTFALATAAGNERKTTGSYYTPTSLVNCLLDSALDPVIAQAAKSENPEQALLDLKICDPACGSGHFLIAAAHRLAKRLATVRTGDEEPSPEETSKALRDVIGRCIFGVDINPMAVELCKVSLWMEAMEPGKPLSFLDHHIQCGNSLLGATPALISRGIPDAAFKPITGDDKAIAATHKKDNKDARKEGDKKGQELFDYSVQEPAAKYGKDIHGAACQLEEIPDADLDDILIKEKRYRELIRSSSYENAYLLADAWCAAFVYPKDEEHQFAPLHTGELLKIERNPHSVNPNLRDEIKQLAERYQFLHWHLAFPQIFQPKETVDEDDVLGWEGGFDCVLGNPPWDKINLKDEEYFAERFPNIAMAKTKSQRKKLIENLSISEPEEYIKYLNVQEEHDRISHYFRNSNTFPKTGVSRVNLYSVFAEKADQITNNSSRNGLVIASGIATDDNNKALFNSLMAAKRLYCFWDFENREKLFPDVDSRYRFCIFIFCGSASNIKNAQFACYLRNTNEIYDKDRIYWMAHNDVENLNPTTKTCPTFRRSGEAEIAKVIYKRMPVWITHEKSPIWPGTPKTPFNMSNDSDLFMETNHEINLNKSSPVYESKYIHQHNHRYASNGIKNECVETNSNQLSDSEFSVKTRYQIKTADLRLRYQNQWYCGYRMITNATNERTSIASIIPESAVGHSLSIMDEIDAGNAAVLTSCINSFVFDYCSRQKVSGTNFSHWIWKQMPILSQEQLQERSPAHAVTMGQFIFSRSLELTFTSYDLKQFSKECSYTGPPYIWDDSRRFILKCEVDAVFFLIYLGDAVIWDEGGEKLLESFPSPRDAVAYIMETFPIVKRKDEKAHGDYRTKDTILEIYDAMLEAQHTGQAYQTRLDPPPGDIRAAHFPEIPSTTRAPFPKSSDYVNYLVYALIGRSIGGCSLKVMTRAFNMLRDKSLSASTLPDIPSDLIDGWSRSFKEQLSQGDLSLIVRQLVERGALSMEQDGEDLKLSLKSESIPDIPAWVGLDADLSLRAALADIASQPELTQAEEAEYSEIYEYAESA